LNWYNNLSFFILERYIINIKKTLITNFYFDLITNFLDVTKLCGQTGHILCGHWPYS